MNEDLCPNLCYMEPNCVSYNFKMTSSGGMHECELNNSTHNSHDQELVENPSYKYHAAKVRNVLEFNPP